MDPLAHSFAGAALAATGLRRATPLATAALLIGVNAPDIDAITMFMDDYVSLQHRRGWSHGVLAWVILPFLVTATLLIWDRFIRLQREPSKPPACAGRLLLLSFIGVLSHPALDWLNNYGIRLLMPFDDRWFYGDALFIIDPWVWVTLGGLCFLVWSRSWPSFLMWCLFWGASSWLITSHPLLPSGVPLIWHSMLALLLLCRFGVDQRSWNRVESKVATIAVASVFAYMTVNATASSLARTQVAAALKDQGQNIESVMVGPVPANPFQGQVVVATPDRYLLGSWDWMKAEHFSLQPLQVRKNLRHPAVVAAAQNKYAQRFLAWSRFPYAEVEELQAGYKVSFNDGRYAGMNRGIKGPIIEIAAP